MEKKEASVPDWVKDIDIGRSAENFLMGVILFVARLAVTSWDYLFRPQKIKDEVLSITELKDTYKISHVRPLVFFVIMGFVCIGFSKSLNQLYFISWIFERYDFLSSGINTKATSFSLARAAVAMIPAVLIVSFYALVSQRIFLRISLAPSFKPHLAICSYTSGLLFLMLLFTNMYEMHVWAEPNSDTILNELIRPAIGIVGMVGSALMSMFVVYRYFYYLHAVSDCSLTMTMFGALLSAVVFWILFLGIGLFVDPVLESLD